VSPKILSGPVVITRLIGGLGNQLFQYAIGRQLAILNDCSLKVDVSGFATYTLHRYGLNHFRIAAEVATDQELRRFSRIKRNRILRRISTEVGPGVFRLGGFHHIEEQSLAFDERILQIRGSAYLSGYWQSEKYFSAIRELLIHELEVVDPPTAQNREMATRIQEEPSVSMHVRLGDYASDPATRRVHGVLDASFYERAMAHVLQRAPEAHFFMFSDDPERAMKVIGDAARRVTPVSFNDASSSFEDLRLMSMAHHHIVANSTFSWWGAWLRRDLSGMVVAPRQWFADRSRDSSDIVPESWILI
jgi:hypothetical protein